MSTSPASPRVTLAKTGGSDEATAALPPAPTRRTDGLGVVMSRNDFYQSNAERMLIIVVGQAILIAALVVVLFKLMSFTDSRDYFFPIQNDNTLILERPLSEPVFTDDQIKDWAENAVTRTFTFGYYDHLMRLQNSRIYFTTNGWASLTKAMTDVQLLERMGAVKSDRINASDMVMDSRMYGNSRPIIKQQGLMGNYYVWQVELRLLAVFRTYTGQVTSPWKVDILIRRIPAMESRDGIGIDQLVAEEYKQ